MKKHVDVMTVILTIAVTFSVVEPSAIFAADNPNVLDGVRYDQISWDDAEFADNPFGTAKHYNGVIFEDLKQSDLNTTKNILHLTEQQLYGNDTQLQNFFDDAYRALYR